MQRNNKVWTIYWGEKINRNCLWGSQILALLNNDFKSAILNMLKAWKEMMSTELSHQVENINEELEIIF